MRHVSPPGLLASVTDPSGFEVPAEALHPDWQADWAPTLRSRAVRAEIAADPRLRTRIGRLVADGLSLPRPDAAQISAGDLVAYRAALADPARLVRLSGLVWHARMLARLVAGQQLRAYAAAVDLDDIRLALGLRDLAPVDQGAAASGFDVARFAEIVDRDGTRLVVAFAEALAPAFHGRLMLTLAKASVFDRGRTPIHKHSCQRIVHSVAERLVGRS